MRSSCARASGGGGVWGAGGGSPFPLKANPSVLYYNYARALHIRCVRAIRFCAHIGPGLLIVQPPLVATTKRTPHVISLFALLGGHSHANFACDVLFSLWAATAMRFRWKFHSHANFACVLCFMCPLGRHTHAKFMSLFFSPPGGRHNHAKFMCPRERGRGGAKNTKHMRKFAWL